MNWLAHGRRPYRRSWQSQKGGVELEGGGFGGGERRGSAAGVGRAAGAMSVYSSIARAPPSKRAPPSAYALSSASGETAARRRPVGSELLRLCGGWGGLGGGLHRVWWRAGFRLVRMK